MYDTSNISNWDTIMASDLYWFECRVNINGVAYGQDQIMEMRTDWRTFTTNQPGVGGCLAAELTVRMLMPQAEIPRMAVVSPDVRVKNASLTSGWLRQGRFFIDTREVSNNDDGLQILELHCYDSMLKAEADYPSTTHSWPYSDINVVKEIAKAMGIPKYPSTGGDEARIDPRTIDLMNKGYQIGLPAGFSMREVLSQIAAMYAGNWVCNYDGQLNLIALNGIPKETNYLVTNTSPAQNITFGGDRILV